MALTQDQFNEYRNYYFVLENGNDWDTGLSTAAQDSTPTQSPVKPRIASMSQKQQDDLLALFDEMVGEIAALS